MRIALVAVVAGLLATPASAANNRTWISGKGVDQAGCGPVASPCRTLQYAHDNTNAGGEIDVLDPAGYGSVKIIKAISIVNDGVGTAGVLATSDDAITINTGSADTVILRGLTIEGAQTAGNGIRIDGVGSLTITRCNIQGFANRGIADFAVSSGSRRISDTTISQTRTGIFIAPSSAVNIDIVLDRVTSTDNAFHGLQVSGSVSSSPGLRLTISNSSFSSNPFNGMILTGGTPITAVITDSIVSMNASGGVILVGTPLPVVTFGRNTIAHNGIGISVANGTGTANTFGNNQFQNNDTDVLGTLTLVSPK